MTTRIFQIGFNRCGTTSLHIFFLRNGISSVHWDRGRIALSFRARMAAGEDPVADYPGTLAFSDMMWLGDGVLIEAYKHIDYIQRFHPQARFVLNTRDREKWIESRLNHVHPMAQRYAEVLGLPDIAAVTEYWRREWEEHHRYVRGWFGDSPSLLIFDIEKDDAAKLTRFLEPDFGTLDASHWGWHHRSKGRPSRPT